MMNAKCNMLNREGARRIPFDVACCLLRIAFCVASLNSPAITAEPTWNAGVAKVVITPAEPVWMAGYSSRKGPSEGVLLDLHAKSLAITDAENHRLVIVTLDLISIPQALRDSLLDQAEKKFGLEPAEVLLNVSHTHCGPMVNPETIDNWGIDSAYKAKTIQYVQFLEQQILDAISQSLAVSQPAQLSYSHARCGFAMNRRLPTDKGYQNSPYPDGPVDHDVPILRVESPDGKLLAVLFGYACHNTTLGIQQINGDYAGFAQRDLETAHPGTIALFLMGCGGDQNPYPRSTVELAEQHGRTLANAVEAALLPEPVSLTPRLQVSQELCPLNHAPLPSQEVLEARAKSSNIYESTHARRVLQLLDEHDGKLPAHEYPIHVIRLGDKLTLAALADEIVIDYSLRLKRELASPNEIVWIAGYSNLVTCYVPSKRVLLEGGYEAGGAMIYTSLPGPFAEDVEERIIDSVHRLVKALKK